MTKLYYLIIMTGFITKYEHIVNNFHVGKNFLFFALFLANICELWYYKHKKIVKRGPRDAFARIGRNVFRNGLCAT